MSKGSFFPPVGEPPIHGRVAKVRRMLGHYVSVGEPVVDLRVGIDLLTLCSPFPGKIMRCKQVGDYVAPYEMVTEVTAVGTPTWELFIAYRRADAPWTAGRIGDRLIADFGAGQVFKDIEALPPGHDFVEIIRHRLERAVAMVVIIGPRWLEGRRLFNDDDLHREEIRTALKRGIFVLPVLVEDARMPRKEDLPDDIQPLVRRHAIGITLTRWDYDIGEVSKAVEPALRDSPRRKAFLAQVPADPAQGWQFVSDDP